MTSRPTAMSCCCPTCPWEMTEDQFPRTGCFIGKNRNGGVGSLPVFFDEREAAGYFR